MIRGYCWVHEGGPRPIYDGECFDCRNAFNRDKHNRLFPKGLTELGKVVYCLDDYRTLHMILRGLDPRDGMLNAQDKTEPHKLSAAEQVELKAQTIAEINERGERVKQYDESEQAEVQAVSEYYKNIDW